MKVKHGNGKTEYGPGVSIELDGDELAIAIDEYISANGADVNGPRTITVNEQSPQSGKIYIDPTGAVMYKGELFSGRGKELKSLEEFNAGKQESFALHGVETHNGIACPKCGEELFDSDPSVVLPTHPPKLNIHCNSCGYIGCRVL